MQAASQQQPQAQHKESETSYNYKGQEYINTFPRQLALCYDYMIGPKVCEECLAHGTVILNGKQIFVCYCLDCCKKIPSANLSELVTIVENTENSINAFPFITQEEFEKLMQITTKYYENIKEELYEDSNEDDIYD